MKKAITCLLCLIAMNFTYGQNQNLSIEIVNGISLVNGDFKDLVEDGFNNELSISKSFCPKLSLAMGVKHSSFNVKEEFGQTQGTRRQFRSLGFDLGPQFSFGSDKLSVILYGRTGLSVNSTPEIAQKHPNTDITTSGMKQQSIKALSARIGAKVNTELCKRIQLFVSSEYATSLNGDVNFYTKDISKAIGADGRIDPDLASEIPTTSSSFNFNSLNVNFGVSIAMGKMGNHPNVRSSNPLYQGNQNKGENPMYQERGQNNNPLYEQSGQQGNNPMYEQGISGGGGHVGQTSGTRAQDYNSSRSNTTSAKEDKKEEDEQKTVDAQDYNSSRSNNIEAVGGDPKQGATKAQDYNSSRSNTTSAKEDKKEEDEQKTVDAQDYNSSRSNNIEAVGGDPKQGATKAQDYNSSRSNTTSAKEDKKEEDDDNKKTLKAQDYNSSRSNNIEAVGGDPNQGVTKAQDYNSSRSNTTSAIDMGDDIRESMLAKDKRKMKRKLRKEERKRLREEQKRRKMQANKVY
ncbi:hypothetical protein DF185_15590 [Marinifilum breve]|uniref:Outer membrane protein beta-barrel domain-containing protein n=1 Tax=Marinifilum breve TaxID=2184082 RepID=A0A2V3ZYG5_9BACT|nr:hypothetical protein [Marinifilum breve]PXX98798.1 hypothetical protein DF185_15590 [Marinifilum breve]